MSVSTSDQPRYGVPTRVDVTKCRTDRITDRARSNRVDNSEVYLERRGGRTFLVTAPSER
ncbi:hypothetical protein J2751_002394 [Halorubrum alkaliphilum]|uniref:Uncharacterized protein n=1 Tax=Halorubrum alkaliphilum TaxID=261290 RepID=A0A8T4GJW3_9EURY|nr:hypothetical protein [Halorubrum alkaliphilum]MBP1923352.1 hypothetical protein [Halorubrum alkaliphilum]